MQPRIFLKIEYVTLFMHVTLNTTDNLVGIQLFSIFLPYSSPRLHSTGHIILAEALQNGPHGP